MLSFSRVAFDIAGVRLIREFDLTVSPHEIVVMVGPSGVGKTTVLRLAAGLERPAAGNLTNSFTRTCVVFQEPRLLPWANARDNVALAAERGGLARTQRRDRAERWLRRLGFDRSDMAKHPLQLSGGMQARVAIARALVTEPDFVLMDEPFAALDLPRRRDLQALTRSLCKEAGAAVLFVTHDLAEAVSLADRIVVMTGSPARITTEWPQRPSVSDADIWSAVADLSRRPEFAAVFGGTAGG
jgi:NitT/TauT family transport system ATP-binding protein